VATATKSPAAKTTASKAVPARATTAKAAPNKALATRAPLKTPSKPIIAKKLQPLADRVVVRANERETMTMSGIVLPDTAKEKPQEGTIIAIGPGRLDEQGKRVKLEVKSGDTVLYARYAGTEIKINGEDLLILRETDVLAVLK
jgi:chaperonin GroES